MHYDAFVCVVSAEAFCCIGMQFAICNYLIVMEKIKTNLTEQKESGGRRPVALSLYEEAGLFACKRGGIVI